MLHLLSRFTLPLITILVISCDADVLQGLRDACYKLTPDDFNYRRAINIKNSGGAQGNYQIKLRLNTATMGTPYNHIRSYGADIRFFTASDVLLDHWIETFDNTGNSFIWIKVPLVPASSSTIYMYYGNDDIPSGSNGDNTFLFFEDFEGYSDGETALDWIPGTFPIVNDGGRTVLSEGTGSEESVRAPTGSYADVAVRERFRSFSTNINRAGPILRWADSETFLFGGLRDDNTARIYEVTSGPSWDQLGSDWSVSITVTDWNIIEVGVVGTNVSLYINNGLVGSSNYTEPSIPSSGSVGINTQRDNEEGYIDWYLVRKFASIEPVVGIGPEESN